MDYLNYIDLGSDAILSTLLNDKVVLAINIVLALLFTLFALHGYKCYKAIVSLEIGLIGFLILFIIPDVHWLVALLVGVALAVISYLLFDKLLGLITFISVWVLCIGILAIVNANMNQIYVLIISTVIALVFAILVVKFTQPILIIYTSISFGMVVGECVDSIFKSPFKYFRLLVSLAIIIIGLVCQIKRYGFVKKDTK